MQYKYITRSNLLTYLDDYSQRGEATLFVYRRGLRVVRWSYKQLVLTAYQTASELEKRGVSKGNRVLVCGENTAEWVAAFWGCLLLGVVVVPLDKDCTAEFASTVRDQTDTRLVFASRNATCVETLNIPLITLDDLSATVDSNSVDAFAKPLVDEDSLAEIIFTSGTTSTPKGVMLTHGNLLANLLPIEAEIARYLKWERFVHPVRFLNLVPLSHVFGQFMGTFVPQLLGGEVHFLDSLNPAEIVERIRKNRISVVVLVPRVLESLKHWVERGRDALISDQLTSHTSVLHRWWKFRSIHRLFGWKFWAFVSGGATLDDRTEFFWQALGFAVLQGYGMTETASVISVTHPFKSSGRSIGQLMPGYEMKQEEGGEIVVRGPGVSPGYWTEQGQVSHQSEWLHTGDVGAVDESGNLHFKGRKKDVIVTAGGLNIYPEDLEEALNHQPEIRSSCVIKWHGPQGDGPLAVIILNDSQANVETVIERTNDRLAEYQKIRHWHIWDGPEFPMTGTQKILKREVAAQVTSLRDAMPKKVESPNFIVAEAARISGQQLPQSNVPSLKLTTDLKLDSLGRIELLSALEDRFQIDIDEAAFTEATTVADVERIVRGEVAEVTGPYPYPIWSYRFPFTWIRILLFYLIILPITLVMSRMRVIGRDKLTNVTRPVLLISNHVTLGDHAMILAALPLRLRHRVAIAMEGERLRDWVHPRSSESWLMKIRLRVQYFLVATFFHVFPLPRKSGFRKSFVYAAECVERGLSVLVFPEGLRAPRGQMEMSKFKSGIGLLAQELDIPVVPVGLRGLYELKRRQQYFASTGMVSVVFGGPTKVEHSLSPQMVAEELQERMEDLLGGQEV